MDNTSDVTQEEANNTNFINQLGNDNSSTVDQYGSSNGSLAIQNGNKKAQHTLDLSNNFEKLLTTILIGNNIVNIASASIATVFFLKFFVSI